MSRIQFDCVSILFFYQCSAVVDGTWCVMPNTTFGIFVICSGYMLFILSMSIITMNSISYNLDAMLYVEDNEVTCYV